MWQWPWMLVFLSLSFVSLSGMPYPLIHTLAHASASAENTKTDSMLSMEARSLLERGKRAFEKKRYEESVTHLKQYIERFPGYPEYFEAKLLLGRSLIALKKFEAAIAYLKEGIGITPATHPEAVLGRLDLGEVYLQNHQNQLAYLTALEIEKLQSQQPLSQEQKIRGLLIKGRSSLRDQKIEGARLILSSAEGETQTIPESLQLSIQSFKLELKLQECSLFVFHHSLTEQQVKDQYERQGLCLMEALNLYHTLFPSRDEALLTSSTNDLKKAFLQYQAQSHSPPTPTTIRGQSQKLKYQAELKDFLVTELTQKFNEARTSLKLWRKTSRPDLNPYIRDLLSVMENSHKGPSA